MSNRDVFFEKVATLTKSDNVRDICKAVQFNGFAVNIILSNENFHAIRIFGQAKASSVNGIHIKTASINYICQSDDHDTEAATIRHEENHIISESFARVIPSQEHFRTLYYFLLQKDESLNGENEGLMDLRNRLEHVLRQRARYPSR